MQYLLMIYADDSYTKMTPEEGKAMGAAYAKYTQDIVQSGHLKGGDRVKPPATAKTIRRGGGKSMTTDGPFAETREQLAGYYIVEADDLDEALTEVAGRIPFTCRRGRGAAHRHPRRACTEAGGYLWRPMRRARDKNWPWCRFREPPFDWLPMKHASFRMKARRS